MSSIPPHLKIIGEQKVAKAKEAFDKMIREYAGENIIKQITAAGKTKLISDALKEVYYYGSTGSLWEAYHALSKVKVTPEMAPFLTKEKIQEFKNRLIQEIGNL